MNLLTVLTRLDEVKGSIQQEYTAYERRIEDLEEDIRMRDRRIENQSNTIERQAEILKRVWYHNTFWSRLYFILTGNLK